MIGEVGLDVVIMLNMYTMEIAESLWHGSQMSGTWSTSSYESSLTLMQRSSGEVGCLVRSISISPHFAFLFYFVGNGCHPPPLLLLLPFALLPCHQSARSHRRKRSEWHVWAVRSHGYPSPSPRKMLVMRAAFDDRRFDCGRWPISSRATRMKGSKG